jgi:ABC-2 type transport system permease protein
MSGLTAFLRKELGETLHTWRIWVLPAILVFIGITAPVITVLTPALLRWAAKSNPGTHITLPEPVARDSYLQFMGNLEQLALLAIIIVVGGAIAGELRSGTATLVLTKPLSRAAFVLAKALTNGALVLLSTAVGVALCVAITAGLLGAGPAGLFLLAVLAWLCFALLMIAVMLLLSARLRSQMAAAAAGIGVFAASAALAIVPALRDYSPVGVNDLATRLLRGETGVHAWPAVSSLVLAGLVLYWAVAVFRRREF